MAGLNPVSEGESEKLHWLRYSNYCFYDYTMKAMRLETLQPIEDDGAPLVPADDSIVLDSTDLTPDQTVAAIRALLAQNRVT